MQVNPNSATPIFKQIVAEMQSAIAAGIYREGEAIPSARVLSLKLKVNPNTIQKAFDELDALGVVETRRGIGKFVTRGAGKHATKQSRQQVLGVFVEGIRKADAAGLGRRDIDSIFQEAKKTPKPKLKPKPKREASHK
jgi:GntR family transcriptional regulator